MNGGLFVWYDLVTRDVVAAERFYSDLLGWKVTPAGIAGQASTIPTWRSGDAAVGGLVPLQGRGEVPSYWLGYVACDDVDATCERAASLGGSVERAPAELPGSGRFAHLRDPDGAPFGVVQGTSSWAAAPGAAPIGQFGFPECWTADPEASLRFYDALFGWTRGRGIDLGPPGTYRVFQHAGADLGGFMPSVVGFHGRLCWIQYVHVRRVDPVAEAARAAGATVLVTPSDLPGMGRFAILEDPTGAVVALYNLFTDGAG